GIGKDTQWVIRQKISAKNPATVTKNSCCFCCWKDLRREGPDRQKKIRSPEPDFRGISGVSEGRLASWGDSGFPESGSTSGVVRHHQRLPHVAMEIVTAYPPYTSSGRLGSLAQGIFLRSSSKEDCHCPKEICLLSLGPQKEQKKKKKRKETYKEKKIAAYFQMNRSETESIHESNSHLPINLAVVGACPPPQGRKRRRRRR
ncbi:hypothetical protein CEXT_139241, partial [Caerostris extrusa]